MSVTEAENKAEKSDKQDDENSYCRSYYGKLYAKLNLFSMKGIEGVADTMATQSLCASLSK